MELKPIVESEELLKVTTLGKFLIPAPSNYVKKECFHTAFFSITF